MAETGSASVLRTEAGGFAELHPPLRPDEAIVAAAKCLYCFDAPCTRACPTHIDIPRFIRQILHNDVAGAAKTILDANIFGGSCARACPTEVLCEGACVDNTHLRSPVQIGRLQRYACDTAHEISMDFYRPGPPTGRRVAIVGAGPAGLSCAHELRQRGHAVTVFDAADLPGGLNTTAIAGYKISTAFALTEVERVRKLGIALELNHPVCHEELTRLVADYDAAFLAVGLGRTAPLRIPGEELAGVWEALDYVRQTHTHPPAECPTGRQVVVIGGGNTAIDVANAAIRLGADNVTVLYRRDRAAMPAFAHECDLALASGVQFMWHTLATEIVGEAGRVSGVRVQRVRQVGQGRGAALEPIPNGEFVLPCDLVIKALGQEPRADFLGKIPGLRLNAKGRIEIDPRTGATSVPKLFAGGDCVAGAGEEIVNAVQAGKVAAAGIHAMLMADAR
jgi:glutamate synthase (NADPH/NADH) small chain